MRYPEQLFWDSLKRNAPGAWWLQRVENGAGEGMPDVLMTTCSGLQHWVELKSVTRPARPTTALMRKQLTVEQTNWHIKAAQMGMSSYVLARDEKKDLYVFSNEVVEQIDRLPFADCRRHVMTYPMLWELLR